MDEWTTLTRSLRSLHGVLLRRTRAEYVQQRGLGEDEVGPGKLLMLATRDESFAWLRSLSELMTDIDELGDSPDARQDEGLRAAVKEAVQELLASPAADGAGTAFQDNYWRHVHADPEVTMAHAAVRQALAPWPAGGSGRSGMAAHLEELRNGPRS